MVNHNLVGGWATDPFWNIMELKSVVMICLFPTSQLNGKSYSKFHGSSHQQPDHDGIMMGWWDSDNHNGIMDDAMWGPQDS